LVLNEKPSALGDDQGMIAGNPRVSDDQVFVNFASDAERSVIEIERPLLAALDENQAGENT
jgi:hypothetical protein